jgi:hypothetical protein
MTSFEFACCIIIFIFIILNISTDMFFPCSFHKDQNHKYIQPFFVLFVNKTTKEARLPCCFIYTLIIFTLQTIVSLIQNKTKKTLFYFYIYNIYFVSSRDS